MGRKNTVDERFQYMGMDEVSLVFAAVFEGRIQIAQQILTHGDPYGQLAVPFYFRIGRQGPHFLSEKWRYVHDCRDAEFGSGVHEAVQIFLFLLWREVIGESDYRIHGAVAQDPCCMTVGVPFDSPAKRIRRVIRDSCQLQCLGIHPAAVSFRIQKHHGAVRKILVQGFFARLFLHIPEMVQPVEPVDPSARIAVWVGLVKFICHLRGFLFGFRAAQIDAGTVHTGQGQVGVAVMKAGRYKTVSGVDHSRTGTAIVFIRTIGAFTRASDAASVYDDEPWKRFIGNAVKNAIAFDDQICLFHSSK